MILNNINNDANVVDSAFEVVHEVKNSIAVCRGYLDIIESRRGNDTSKYFSMIRNEINRSSKIIDEFMLYKKMVIKKEIMDINLLLKDLGKEMEAFVRNKNILFDINVLDTDIYIDGDYDRLKQVFINLIKNSVEAIGDLDGKIEVVSYVLDDECYVLVKDNGLGMSENVLSKLGQEGFTTKMNGSGIGINFSRRILSEHNGKINYYSKYGVGTKVVVKLPVIML